MQFRIRLWSFFNDIFAFPFVTRDFGVVVEEFHTFIP